MTWRTPRIYRSRWDQFCHWLAQKLPKTLVHWACIRLAGHALAGEYKDLLISELTVTDALREWPI